MFSEMLVWNDTKFVDQQRSKTRSVLKLPITQNSIWVCHNSKQVRTWPLIYKVLPWSVLWQRTISKPQCNAFFFEISLMILARLGKFIKPWFISRSDDNEKNIIWTCYDTKALQTEQSWWTWVGVPRFLCQNWKRLANRSIVLVFINQFLIFFFSFFFSLIRARWFVMTLKSLLYK